MGISQAMPLTIFYSLRNACCTLTHCGRVTHIKVSKFTIICPDNGLSPDRCIGSKWPIVMYCVYLITRVSRVQIDVKMRGDHGSYAKYHLSPSGNCDLIGSV